MSMKTVTYPLRLDKKTMRRVELEAKRRSKSMADAGMEGLVADTWEKLGSVPDIDYGKFSR
jgi:hypothetical protein